MKRIFTTLAILLFALQLSACGRIDQGNAGIRTDFNGSVAGEAMGTGFYTSVTSHVDEYSMKEVPIDLDNMTPKAKDNLSLAELDVTVYYKVNSPQALHDLVIRRTGSSAHLGDGIIAPGFTVVSSIARSEIADVISKIDSLTAHTQRDTIQNNAKTQIQSVLNASDPGTFTVTRVVVRQVKTDPTIEASIRNVVSKEKELEAAKLQVAIAEKNAEATHETSLTLTDAYLRHEYNQVLLKFAEHGGTVILDGSSSSKILNLAK